jgi:hypothetical protein
VSGRGRGELWRVWNSRLRGFRSGRAGCSEEWPPAGAGGARQAAAGRRAGVRLPRSGRGGRWGEGRRGRRARALQGGGREVAAGACGRVNDAASGDDAGSLADYYAGLQGLPPRPHNRPQLPLARASPTAGPRPRSDSRRCRTWCAGHVKISRAAPRCATRPQSCALILMTEPMSRCCAAGARRPRTR